MKKVARRRSAYRHPSSSEGHFFRNELVQERGLAIATPAPDFFQPAAIQRKCEQCEEDEKKLQRKATDGTSSGHSSTPRYIQSLNGKGSALPESARSFFGRRMGFDFSKVKIHTGEEAENSARALNAKAYTLNEHIVFNSNQFDFSSVSGKKLLAHELAHVMQQASGLVQRQEAEEMSAEECTAGSVDLEALTTAGYHKGAGSVANEKTSKGSDCDGCDDDCVNITGTLRVPFKVNTKINLPTVPGGLSPCQRRRVSAAINGPLLTHERQHVKAFETFNGTGSLPVSYHGCQSGYTSYLADLADQEFQSRQSAADAKSAALDPFTVPVDLCCKD